MKKTLTVLMIFLGMVSFVALYHLFISKALRNEEVTDVVYRAEERPKEKISDKEMRVNQRHLARFAPVKSSLKTATTNSSYANGKEQGSWDQVQFLASNQHSYGFRVDGSVYDPHNDVIYAISYAGHIWKINRKESDFRKTQWELMNHKYNFKTSYIEGLNKADGSFRMVRSSDTGMQYSDDEGRNWTAASGIQYVEKSYEGAVSKTNGGSRIFVAGKTNSTTIKTFISSNNGESYTVLSPAFQASTYTIKVFKPCNSGSVFLVAFNKSTSKISIYECAANATDFTLINSPDNTFTGLSRVLGTYHNEKFYLYIAGAETHIYYSEDKGATWQTKSNNNSGDGDIFPRTVHPTKPNIIFRGYLDVNYSTNYGATFSNFSHVLGWDVHHMKMYQKTDGSYFHFVGMDFGCYISETPEIASTYVQLNNTAPTQMCYDADHGQNYNSSFTATQDRGTMGYVSSSNTSYTTDVKTTDGLRVTLANNDESVWTWMYYGTIFHQSNFAARTSALAKVDYTSNWWAAPMVVSPNKKEDAVYVAADKRLTKFTFNPTSNQIVQTEHYFDFYKETGNMLTGFGYSPLNPQRWYASVKNGDFLYSLDGGQSFEKSAYAGIFPGANDQYYNYSKNQHVIKASNISEERVYYAGVGNLFMISDDGGKTFTNHNTGLDIYRIRDFDFTPDEKFIFAACAYGGIWVYSVDGDQWYEMNDEAVPYVNFTDVEYIKKENTVNFATYGNGVLRLKLDGYSQQIMYPNNLAAEITNTGSVKLQWTDNSNNEDGFIIERSTNGVFSSLANVASNQNVYTDESIQSPGVYYYRIKAFNASDESYYSNYVVVTMKPEGEVSKEDWKLVSVDSEETNGYGAALAFDDNTSTMWHTQWNITPKPSHPHTLIIDMNQTIGILGFSYLPRQDNTWNGTIKEYEFYVSEDKVTWTKVASGSWEKTFDLKEEFFATTVQARYLKLVALSEVNGSVFASCAELSVLTKVPVSTVPQTPQFVQGGRLSETEIELIWLDLSDDEDGFVVEQLIDGSFTPVYSSNEGETTFYLQNTNKNASYSFRVAAFNNVGYSEYSDTLTLRNLGTPVGIEKELLPETALSVYPNPFTEEFNIVVGANKKYYNWHIFDLTGKNLKSGTFSEYGQVENINLRDLKSGSYILKIDGESGSSSKAIIKK